MFGQVDVGPAGEAVFLVPGALAVTQQDDFVHGSHDRASAATAERPAYAACAPSSSSMRSSWLYFADAVGAAGRAGLDLPAAGADREVGDRRVLGLAGAVRDDRA